MARHAGWTLTAALALALAAGAAARAQFSGGLMNGLGEDRAEVALLGRVQTLGSLADSFTVQARTLSFRVSYSNRFAGTRPSLRRGDRVRVVGTLLETDRVTADSVVVLGRGDQAGGGAGGAGARSTIAGTIRRIDREARELRVATEKGDTVRVQWDDETDFLRDRVRSGPREFFQGDKVRITGRREGREEMAARRVVYGGAPGWTNGAEGEIVGLNARTREVEVDFDGEVWTIRTTGARLRSREDGQIDFDNLRLGQEIRVQGTARPSSRVVEAQRVDVVRGAGRR